jgi:hypothetical protein
MNSPLRATALAFGMLVSARLLPAATITVTSAGDEFPLATPDGLVTLREALLSIEGGADVNADVVGAGTYGDNDTVLFNIAGLPPFVITPVIELPAMNVPVIIDGFSQPGASANTQAIGNDAVVPVHLIGPSGPLGYGIKLASGTFSVVRGLTIGSFFYGIDIATSHATVEGCFIGTDPAGSTAIGNENGVKVQAAAIGANAIGGALPSQRNVISGNAHYGIAMASGSGFRNPIQGNYIGVTPDGTAALPNGEYGIAIFSLQGVSVDGPDIGGPTASPGKGPGNVISGNGGGGILINASGVSSTITSGQISGNILGLDATGTVALGNGGGHGIDVDDVSLQGGGPFGIGQVAVGGNGAGNVISGNDRGIRVAAATALIRGNLIGTDVTGTEARSNVVGVEVDGVGAFGAGATIGAGGVGEGNVIAGNSTVGIRAHLGNATVQGNRIGVGLAGGALGNGSHGVEVDSANGTIGGTTEGDENQIAHNGGTGVDVVIGSPGIHNASYAQLLRNAIYDNGLAQAELQRMAINLDVGDQQTPNDPGDPDTGPNNLQNYPVISSATIVDGVLTVSGTLDSPASGDYRVELFASPTCNPNGSGEGKTFLGFVALGDGGGGSARPDGTSTDFSNLTFPVPDGQSFITATATDNAVAATSELSPCVEATFGGSSPVPLGGETVVNSNAAGAQERPAIASSTQGDVVVAWQSEAADASGRGIVGRRFSRSGQALGAEFLVNQTVAGDQTDPALAADDAGRFVVAWQGASGAGVGVYLRMYEANGTPATGEIEVVPSTTHGLPAVALNEAGDVLVAWHGVAASGPDVSGTAILARVYAFGSATPVTGVLTVNTTTLGDQTDAAAVALDLSGDFVVAWAGSDADGRGIYAQRLLPSGAPRPGSPERLVNVTTVGDQEAPAIAASGLDPDPDDENLWVVAWEGPDGDQRGVYLRRFAQSNDTPRGGEERVPEVIDGDQAQATIAVDDGRDGTVHVTAAWICAGTASCTSPNRTPEAIEGAPILVRGRRVGGPGRVAGPNEFTISQSLSAHTRPAIAGGADGDFAVAWESSGQDGSGETILGRRFTVQLIFRDDFESGGPGAWEP